MVPLRLINQGIGLVGAAILSIPLKVWIMAFLFKSHRFSYVASIGILGLIDNHVLHVTAAARCRAARK